MSLMKWSGNIGMLCEMNLIVLHCSVLQLCTTVFFFSDTDCFCGFYFQMIFKCTVLIVIFPSPTLGTYGKRWAMKASNL